MRLFGRERDSLRVKKVRASRAVYQSEDIQNVEIRLMTEEGQILDLILSSRSAATLHTELGTALEAIYPRLSRGSGYATWDGMRD